MIDASRRFAASLAVGLQLQSFDDPTTGQRLRGWFVDRATCCCRRTAAPAAAGHAVEHPAGGRHEPRRQPRPGAAAPGPLRPRVTFELPRRPAAAARRPLPGEQGPHAELDDPATRDALAAVTQGYSPVMIEHLLDEALVNAVAEATPR
jgi:hypothetical protein